MRGLQRLPPSHGIFSVLPCPSHLALPISSCPFDLSQAECLSAPCLCQFPLKMPSLLGHLFKFKLESAPYLRHLPSGHPRPVSGHSLLTVPGFSPIQSLPRDRMEALVSALPCLLRDRIPAFPLSPTLTISSSPLDSFHHHKHMLLFLHLKKQNKTLT